MSKSKPDKEMSRLRHELENERQKLHEAQNQISIKNSQLDAAETLNNKLKAGSFETENEALRKELAGVKENVRILKSQERKAEQEARAARREMDICKEKIRGFEKEQGKLRRQQQLQQQSTSGKQQEKGAAVTEEEKKNDKSRFLAVYEAELNQLKQFRQQTEEVGESFVRGNAQLRNCITEQDNAYEKLSNTHETLVKKYGELVETHQALMMTHAELEVTHETLQVSYERLAKKYKDLYERALERDKEIAKLTGYEYKELLQKHKDLRRDYAEKIRECENHTEMYDFFFFFLFL